VQVMHSKLCMMLLQVNTVLQLRTRWCGVCLPSFPGSITRCFSFCCLVSAHAHTIKNLTSQLHPVLCWQSQKLWQAFRMVMEVAGNDFARSSDL